MKRFIKISMILICIFLITGCDFGKEEEYKYKLTLYNLNEIDNVTIDTLGQFDNLIEITDKSKIKIIYYMFEGKKSNEESSGDNPENPDKLYSVSFNTEHNKRSIFIFKKDDKYYIEEANEGLYESSEEDFEKLESMLKDNDYKYKIDNYKIDDVKKVIISSMGQFDEPVELTDNRNISILYNIFSNKRSNIESTDYNPDSPEVLFHVRFYDNKEGINPKEFYIYKKGNKYFIEQSFVGIFISSESEFDIVKGLSESNQKTEKKEG